MAAAALTAFARSDGPIRVDYPAAFTGQIDITLGAWGLNQDFTGACMIGMLAAMDGVPALQVTRAANPIAGNALQILSQGQNAANIVEGNLAGVPASDEKTFLTLCIACRPKGLTWLLDLCIAEQHKKLKSENVVSYFMMQTHKRVNGVTILRLIEPAASTIDNIRVANAAAIPDTVWMRYRITATSTPGLVRRALEIWGAIVPNLVSPQTTLAINAAATSPWNVNLAHQLPDRLIVLTHATLSAYKMLPDDWYYGSTVVNRSSASLYSGYYETAKKIKEVGGNIAAIKAAADIVALQAAIPATLTGI